MRALSILALSLAALASCGSDPAARPSDRSRAAVAQPEASTSTPPDSNEETPAPEASPTPAAPDFDAPLPEEACPNEVRVRVAHRSAATLPPLLTHALALRSDDGRRVRVVIADHALERDALGRFRALAPGEARFELDAIRARRGPLAPQVLGTTDNSRGALTHARIVQAGPLLTFGNRHIGRVELTEIGGGRICGRIDLDDGFGRVRGAFVAPIVGAP